MAATRMPGCEPVVLGESAGAGAGTLRALDLVLVCTRLRQGRGSVTGFPGRVGRRPRSIEGCSSSRWARVRWWRKCNVLLRHAIRALALAVLVAACAAAQPDPAQQATSRQPATTGTLRGVVTDAQSSQPLSGVPVRLAETGVTATSDALGRFELSSVSPGTWTLVVSLVSYTMVRREVAVAAGEVVELIVALPPGVGAYAERVDVVGRAAPAAEPQAPRSVEIGAADLLELRGVAADDPFRALQALPGVAATDDFRAEFSVRGSAPRSLGVTLDGVASPLLVHTVRSVDETGSVAMINSDVLERATLLAGSYPQRVGDRTGARLDLAMRQGSRERLLLRGAVSGTTASVTAEGPLGSSKRGSWLASARRSYIDWLIDRVAPDLGSTFGFSDVQSKLAYDVAPDQRLELILVGGHARAEEDDEDVDVSANGFEDGESDAGQVILAWRWLHPQWSYTQRVAGTGAQFRNRNAWAQELAGGTDEDLAVRGEFTWAPNARLALDAGVQANWSWARRTWRTYTASPGGAPLVRSTLSIRNEADAQGAYVHASVPLGAGSVSAGLRVDHASWDRDPVTSPWAQVVWPVTHAVTLRGGGGVFRQAPGLEPLGRALPGQALARERATHADLGVEWAVGRRYRATVTGYVRDEHDMLRAYGSEYTLAGTVVVPPFDAPFYASALAGRARGVEAALERKDADRWSGWLSYNWGRLAYDDALTGERFDADFDQRHSASAYLRVRLSPQTSVSLRVRAASNFPIPGYWEQRGGVDYLGDTRNQLRLPVYARCDARANHTFHRGRMRLTLFAEVLNVLDRENLRAADPSVNRRTQVARGLTGELFPLLPSAGVLVEF